MAERLEAYATRAGGAERRTLERVSSKLEKSRVFRERLAQKYGL
jgi:hypothetical protein